MLNISFDPSNTKLALAIGTALVTYANDALPNTIAGPDSMMSDEEKEATFFATPAPELQLANTLQEASETPGESAAVAGDPLSSAPMTAGTELQPNVSGAAGAKPTHDEKGVQFIPAICANAQKPFYASGTYKGQWKKGTKVDQAEYDKVYAAALAALGGRLDTPATQTGRFDGTQENQSNVGQQVANSPAAQVFGGDPINDTVAELPATPEEVFTLYTSMIQNGGAGVANAICGAAGIANGTLIFSRPDLAPKIYAELKAAQAQLVAGQGA